MAISVILTIGLIVPFLKAHQVPEGKTIMAGNEIDTGLRCTTAGFEDVGRTVQMFCQTAELVCITAPETPHAISVTIVPLSETGWELPQLITPRAWIPGFRYEFCST